MEKELTIAKQDAEQASKAKTQFLANMSHEIRSPLNSIVGFSQILLRNSKNNSMTHESIQYLRSIQMSGKNLSELVNNILDLSKIESGKLAVSKEVLNLKLLAQGCFHIIQSQAIPKNIKLHYEVDPQLPDLIFSDRTKLNNVFINLLSNAVKFTPEGKNVFFRLWKDKNKLCIEVEDEGIGIEQAHHQKIFEAFEQADISRTREYGGTGLGLTIMKKVVALLGGKISLKSILEKGSSFLIELPLEVAKEEYHNPNYQWIDFKFQGNYKVLVVDDSHMNQQMNKAILDDLGVLVKIAMNGEDGIKIAKQWQPDLIFMDMHMPKMDGIETTRILKKSTKTLQIPVVALSANAFREQQQEALKQGLSDYLTKPIELEKLVHVMLKYLPQEEIKKQSIDQSKKEIPVVVISDIQKTFRDLKQVPFFLSSKIITYLNKIRSLCEPYQAKEYLEIIQAIEEVAYSRNEEELFRLIETAQHLEERAN
ncbi:MAG: CheY-like chemotaxis protein [bacterium]|jgi:CheY-like chemotaxis protein